MLGPKDIMPFGRAKGMTVEDLILRDPDYVNWLRSDKIKKSKENLLTPEADALLKKRKLAQQMSSRVSETALTDKAADVARKAMEHAKAAELHVSEQAAKRAAIADKEAKQRQREADRRIEERRQREENQDWGAW